VRRYPESKLRIRHYSVESVEDAGPIRGPAGRFVQRRRVRAKNPRSDKEMGVRGGSWVSWSGKEKSGLELGGGRGVGAAFEAIIEVRSPISRRRLATWRGPIVWPLVPRAPMAPFTAKGPSGRRGASVADMLSRVRASRAASNKCLVLI
jgi:hypothetical protein